VPARHPPTPLLLPDADDIRDGADPTWSCKMA
jgi:hypothetical protein